LVLTFIKNAVLGWYNGEILDRKIDTENI